VAEMVRAAVQTGPRQIEIREFRRPVIGPDDGGLLHIEACGICGSEVEEYEGNLGRQSLPMVPPADWPATERADDSARALASGPMRFTARSAWFDAERRLAASAASGVDAEVVSPFPPLLNYRLPAGPGLDLARAVNEYVASLCAAYPGRFYGLGTVPLQRSRPASAGRRPRRGRPRPARPSWRAGSTTTRWCSTGAPSGTSSTCSALTGCWWGPTSRPCPGGTGRADAARHGPARRRPGGHHVA
jgi:hypothetical protein